LKTAIKGGLYQERTALSPFLLAVKKANEKIEIIFLIFILFEMKRMNIKLIFY